MLTLYVGIGRCCSASLSTVVNKDSFESSLAGLFTSNDANKAALIVQSSTQSRCRCTWTRRSLGQCFLSILWKKTVGKLDTLTAVDLIANVRYQ